MVPTDDNSEDWRDFFTDVVSENDELMNKKQRRAEKEGNMILMVVACMVEPEASE